MHITNVKITYCANITGRGIALFTDLDYDAEHHRFNKGDTIDFKDKVYEIIGVNAAYRGGKVKRDFVALLSKEIEDKKIRKIKDYLTWIKNLIVD